MCQGDVDHIGSIGQRHACPTLDELRDELSRRGKLSSSADGDDAPPSAPAAGGTPSKRSPTAADWNPSDAEHLADLARRFALSSSATQYGKAHPYATLGVPSSATQREVRNAYKHLATRLHPDRNLQEHVKVAEAAFADLSAAHDLLSDQMAREAFDAEAVGGQAFFHDEASFAASGQQFAHNLYPASGLVTELTESSFSKLVQGSRIFLIQFYSPWCSHCQSSAPLFKAAAEKLADEEGAEVDVGAVNCHKWPGLCSRFDVRAYPSVKMVSGQGMVQDSEGHLIDSEGLATWAKETASEWRWLFGSSDTALLSEGDFAGMLQSTDFWLVLFVDGTECGPCRTARTNLMRLSATSRGRARTGVVDCERLGQGWDKNLCGRLGLPRPPHAPILRAFHKGNKTSVDVGEELYNPAEIESHVALKLVEAVLRLSGEPEVAALTLAGDTGKWDKDPKEEEETPTPAPTPRRPKWNGPPPRAIHAGGFGGGGGAPPPMVGR